MQLRGAPVLLALAVGAATPVGLRGQTPWSYGGVGFPSAIDTFVNQAASRWPGHPDLGVSLTYVIPGDESTELTVYLYPLRPEDSLATRGDAAPERDRALDEARAYAGQYRQLDEFRVDSTGVQPLVLADGRRVEGHYASMYFRRGQSQLRSLLYVFVSGGTYVKFRISYHPSEATALTSHVMAFLSAALSTIRPGAS